MAIVQSNELEKGMAKLKEMETGKETNLKLDNKFADNFDSVYIDKMLDTIDEAAIALTEAKNFKENKENG